MKPALFLISSIFKETKDNLNFLKHSLIINALTTVIFSKTDIFLFDKLKFQMPIFPDLCFNFVEKRDFLSTKYETRDSTAGGSIPYKLCLGQ